MAWTEKDYPDSLKNFDKKVRNKAIDIANALVDEENLPDGIAIPTAISKAKDWATSNGVAVFKKTKDDRKTHGKDQYVTPHENGWAIKANGAKNATKVFYTKKEAVKRAKEIAKNYNAHLTIQRANGTIEKKYSYNPR